MIDVSSVMKINANYDGTYHKVFLCDLDMEDENLSDQMIDSLFKDLRLNKNKMEDYYIVNLKPTQLNIVEYKKEVLKYDPNVIKKIEGWLSKISNLEIYNGTQEGINIENILSAYELYNNYVEAQRRYVEEDKKLKDYTDMYASYKERDSYIKNKILVNRVSLIDEILVTYFRNSDLELEDTFLEGVQALKDAIRKYDVNFTIEFKDFAKKIIINRIRKKYKMIFGHEIILDIDECAIDNKDYKLRKLISMIKTKMKIDKVYQLFMMIDSSYTDDVVDKLLEDLDGIVKIFRDTKVNEANRDIELVVNVYDISTDLALYIYKNMDSIIPSLKEFLVINNLD